MKTRCLFLFVATFVATLVFAALPGNAPYYNAALSSTAVRVSATPAYLVGYNIANPNSSTVYVQFFNANATGNVTVGTTSPTMVLAIPGNGVLDGIQTGSAVPFSTGIVIAATTTATGSTAPSTALSATVLSQ